MHYKRSSYTSSGTDFSTRINSKYDLCATSSMNSCRGRTTYTQRLVAITLLLLAMLSPLYIDRRTPIELDDDYRSSAGGYLPVWLPLVLIILVFVINLTCFVDKKIMRFDPYWIHRFGGSSCGIVMLLLVLGFVLKCKASLRGEV